MLGKIEGGRRRGRQRMRWLDGITNSIDEFEQTPGQADCILRSIGSQRVGHDPVTEQQQRQAKRNHSKSFSGELSYMTSNFIPSAITLQGTEKNYHQSHSSNGKTETKKKKGDMPSAGQTRTKTETPSTSGFSLLQTSALPVLPFQPQRTLKDNPSY